MSQSAQKTQLQQITEDLLASLSPIIQANDIDAWQEAGTLLLGSDDLGNGYRVGQWKHTAVIFIECFPHKRINPYNLLASIGIFFNSQEWANERESLGLADPSIDIDIDPSSKDNAKIVIELELIDNIDIAPNAQGPLLFNGERYSVGLASIDVATEFELEGSIGDEHELSH